MGTTEQVELMFTLNPNGGHGSSSSSESSSGWAGVTTQFKFFGKLVTYFVVTRLVHVYWGDPRTIEN